MLSLPAAAEEGAATPVAPEPTAAVPAPEAPPAETPLPPPPAPAEEKDERRMQTVVTGTRTEQRASDVTVATEVIRRVEIDRSGARNLAELLTTHPGIDIVESFRGSGVRLQGLDPEYVLILIDGERIGGRVGTTFDVSRFSLQEIERVEIVKGPSSVLYGSDAIGGVINLVTRRPQKPLEAVGRLGSGGVGPLGAPAADVGGVGLGDVRGGVGGKLGTLDGRAQASYRHNNAWDWNPANAATNGSDTTLLDTSGVLNWAASENLSVRSRVAYTRKDQAAVDQTPGGAVSDRRFRDEYADASLSARLMPRAGTEVRARVHGSLFRDQFQQDQRQARDQDQYQDARDMLWEVGLQLDQSIAGAHLVSAAVEGLFEDLRSDRVGGFRERRRLGVMLQDDWKVLPGKLSVTFGARVDVDSRFGTAPSPRVGMKWDPLENLAVRAGYGWGFRAPNFQELFLRFENPSVGYVVEGNPTLKPELSRGYNLSADWRVREGLSVSASLFRTELSDLITVLTLREASPDAPLTFGYGNVSRATTQGGELTARFKLVRSMYLDVGYAFTDSRDDATGKLLPGRAQHRGTAQLSGKYRPLDLDCALRVAVQGIRPFDEENPDGIRRTVAPPFAVVDLRLGKPVLPWLTVFVMGNNLLNAGDALYLPIQPRNLQAGVTVQYPG
ncbi:MAG: hypothetical protein RL653_782 [Pseudomonadota bacterium]